MKNKIEANIEAHFGHIEDPRRTYLNDHPLINIITIALCAVIAGAEGWTDIEMFGQQKREWLSRFLDLENGIPSHDTFGRVLCSHRPRTVSPKLFVLGTGGLGLPRFSGSSAKFVLDTRNDKISRFPLKHRRSEKSRGSYTSALLVTRLCNR